MVNAKASMLSEPLVLPAANQLIASITFVIMLYQVTESSTGINLSSDSHDRSNKITHFPQQETSTDLSVTSINREFSYDQHDCKTSILQFNIKKPHD